MQDDETPKSQEQNYTIPSAQCGPLGEPDLTVTVTSVAKTEGKGSPQNAV